MDEKIIADRKINLTSFYILIITCGVKYTSWGNNVKNIFPRVIRMCSLLRQMCGSTGHQACGLCETSFTVDSSAVEVVQLSRGEVGLVCSVWNGVHCSAMWHNAGFQPAEKEWKNGALFVIQSHLQPQCWLRCPSFRSLTPRAEVEANQSYFWNIFIQTRHKQWENETKGFLSVSYCNS